MKDKNRKKKGKGIKWKTITKKMVINPNILKTTLNVNGLNILSRRQRLSGWIKKENLVHII